MIFVHRVSGTWAGVRRLSDTENTEDDGMNTSLTKLGSLAFVIGLALSTSAPACSWSDHATLAWPLMRTMPELLETEPVAAESLVGFLESESDAIAALLEQQESWARSTMPAYAALPEALNFRPDLRGEKLEQSFLRAIRVNPSRSYRPYAQLFAYEQPSAGETLVPVADLTFLQGTIATNESQYLALSEGELVEPGRVLATASDEPDFGLDIGLFEDNNTPHGALYGFGIQPFGNPNLEYGSQAPFHMGFYHLDWLTSKAQPGLLATYPQYRVSLYRNLSVLAFKTGHDYWGWRFAGWGLHYVGDLTQPYHAVPLPGVSLLDSLLTLVKGEVEQAVQLVSNRHGVIEAFQYQLVRGAIVNEDWDQSTLELVARPSNRIEWQETTLVDELALESVQAADRLDSLIESNTPSKLVSDPAFEFTGSAEDASILEVIASHSPQATAGLTMAVNEQMERFSVFAQAWIRGILYSSE